MCVSLCVCMCVSLCEPVCVCLMGEKTRVFAAEVGGVGEGERSVGSYGEVETPEEPRITLLGSLALGSPCWPVQKLQLNRLPPPIPPGFNKCH